MPPALSRSLSLYYSDVGHAGTPKSDDNECSLIRQWQTSRDPAARDKLLKRHLRFVVKMAHKRTRDPQKLEDLIAAGNLGLVKALDHYDLTRRPAVRFLTYAGSWINKEMLDNDYTMSNLLHVPTHRQKARRKKARQLREEIQRLGPSVDDGELLKFSGPEAPTVSLDVIRSGGDERGASDGITLREIAQISGGTAEILDTDQILRYVIAKLPIREQTVLNLYYGVKDEPRTFVQIGNLLGMCPERIRQLKVAGVWLLRAMLATRHDVISVSDAY